MQDILSRYAQLLVGYSLDIRPGDRLFINTTLLAEPLVREVYRHALRAGAAVDVEWEFEGMYQILHEEAGPAHLSHVSPLYDKAMEAYEAYLYIIAPFEAVRSYQAVPEKAAARREAYKEARERYTQRTANRSLKRSLCLYPTTVSAREAGMSLEEYERFVYNACKLYDADPIQSWLDVRRSQQGIVDHLNQCTEIRYIAPGTDLRFSTQGRTWINSDGQTNMPSGEVYTSPVEDSVQGEVYFSFPATYDGNELEGVKLWVENGRIARWDARRGKEALDHVFEKIEGARYFGEAAIGTNYSIQRQTRNILFDEKMGGTFHLAIGQSYLQTGGKNHSDIHWDFISDMRQEGEIWADGRKIYEKGYFLPF